MTDLKKFKILLFASAALVGTVLLAAPIRETVLPDVESYFKRRLYYEGVISKKGLGLHRGSYWKER